jgi:hypothetical protein
VPTRTIAVQFDADVGRARVLARIIANAVALVDDAAVTGVDGFSMLDPGWRGLVKITMEDV